MSAKEMFEKLSFAKTIEIQYDFDLKVLEAINQQVKELGWLEDEK